MAKVVVKLQNRTIREVHIGKEPVRIGRDPSNEIHLENPAVSRFHAVIYRQGWPFFIEDKKSTNGVFVNGNAINWKCGLKDNDQITIGKHTLVFQEGASDHPDGKPKDIAHFEGTIRVNPDREGKS